MNHFIIIVVYQVHQHPPLPVENVEFSFSADALCGRESVGSESTSQKKIQVSGGGVSKTAAIE